MERLFNYLSQLKEDKPSKSGIILSVSAVILDSCVSKIFIRAMKHIDCKFKICLFNSGFIAVTGANATEECLVRTAYISKS